MRTVNRKATRAKAVAPAAMMLELGNAAITSTQTNVRTEVPAMGSTSNAESKLPIPPTEESTLEQLTLLAQEAAKLIAESIGGYVSAGYWRLGRCMALAQKHYGKNKVEYTAWEKGLRLPSWSLSRARKIAQNFPTQEEAAQYDVVTAYTFKADPQKPAPNRPVKVPAVLTIAEQRANDVEANLAIVSDVDFLDCYERVVVLARQFCAIVDRYADRAAQLAEAKKAKSLVVAPQ
jgi:hypothetical protein